MRQHLRPLGLLVPSLYDGDKLVTAGNDLETIYYKSGVSDYRTVRPFPNGLRFVVGSPTDTKEQFQNLTGTVNGFECGDIDKVYDFPVSCPAGTDLTSGSRPRAAGTA